MGNQIIILGHPSYSGANARAVCRSKADAVRVLRDRGMKRDDARNAINRQAIKCNGVIDMGDFETVEIAFRDASEYAL